KRFPKRTHQRTLSARSKARRILSAGQERRTRFVEVSEGAMDFAAWAGGRTERTNVREYGRRTQDAKDARLVLGGVYELVLGNPRHHGAQLLAHFFDGVLVAL